MAEPNAFRMAQAQLDLAAQRLGLDEATTKLLRWPQKELVVTIPVRMDDGRVRGFKGPRFQGLEVSCGRFLLLALGS